MQNKNALYLLMLANIISGCAQGISMLAIPWYFIDIKGKGSEFGVVYATITILTLFWSLYSGTLIDKYSRKRLFQIINAAGFLFLGLSSYIGFQSIDTPLWIVAGVFCFTMMNYQIHYPTLYAFGQEIVERKDYAKMNSLLEIQGQIANMSAGFLAAVLITGVNENSIFFNLFSYFNISFAPWTIKEVFALDSFTYLISFLIISGISYTPLVVNQIEQGKILKRLKTGYDFLKNNKPLFQYGNASYTVFVFMLVELQMIMAIYVSNHLKMDGSVFSLGYAMYSIGALIAGLLLRRLVKQKYFIHFTIVFMIACGLSSFVLGVVNSFIVFTFLHIVFGLTNAGTRIMRVTYLFNNVPNNIIGRISSIFHVINVLMRFCFIMLFSMGFFSESNNIKYAYYISAIFLFLFTIPIFRNMKKLVD